MDFESLIEAKKVNKICRFFNYVVTFQSVAIPSLTFLLHMTGKKVKLKVSSRGIKTVEKKGGIDNYVITSKSSVLAPEIVKLKKLIESKRDIKN